MKSLIARRLFVTIFSSSIILISCEKSVSNVETDPGELKNITTDVYQKEVIDSANRFAFNLFKPILNDAEVSENILICPFSI